MDEFCTHQLLIPSDTPMIPINGCCHKFDFFAALKRTFFIVLRIGIVMCALKIKVVRKQTLETMNDILPTWLQSGFLELIEPVAVIVLLLWEAMNILRSWLKGEITWKRCLKCIIDAVVAITFGTTVGIVLGTILGFGTASLFGKTARWWGETVGGTIGCIVGTAFVGAVSDYWLSQKLLFKALLFCESLNILRSWLKGEINWKQCFKCIIAAVISSTVGTTVGILIGLSIAGLSASLYLWWDKAVEAALAALLVCIVGCIIAALFDYWLTQKLLFGVFSDFWLIPKILFKLPKEAELENAYEYLEVRMSACNIDVNTAFMYQYQKYCPNYFQCGSKEFFKLLTYMGIIRRSREEHRRHLHS